MSVSGRQSFGSRGVKEDGFPSGIDGSFYVSVRVVAYHDVASRIGFMDLAHGIFVKPGVRLVHSYVVAEHHDVDEGIEAVDAQFLVLYVSEAVAEHT